MLSKAKHLAISKAYAKQILRRCAPQNDILTQSLEGERIGLEVICGIGSIDERK
jgi:hypothetical protein